MIRNKKSAPKFDDGKVEFDKVPPYPLWETIKVFNQGGNNGKYPARSWEKGMSWGKIFSALMRHAWKFWAGQSIDPDDNVHHLAHCIWCCMVLMEYEKTHLEYDDRSNNHTLLHLINSKWSATWSKVKDLVRDESRDK